ncbi:MAG: D-sedoheptulose 7-phosphate isomerase [Armatimonadetes bacterium]|nr:D-sedoheptulose 7-phosphate isomerase [Armatimonadota bacterium]
MSPPEARNRIDALLSASISVKEALRSGHLDGIVRFCEMAGETLRAGGKLIFLGNGGSAADAQHLAAELAGRFQLERNPLPAIALTTNTSILTAVGNDYGFDQVFSRQLEAVGRAGDLVVAISTSGNSPNILEAALMARKKGLLIVGMTGDSGGKLASHVDLLVSVPSANTARIQEAHITIGHILCELVEESLVKDGGRIS